MTTQKRTSRSATADFPRAKNAKTEGLQTCPLFKKEESPGTKADETLSNGLQKCCLFGLESKTPLKISDIQLGISQNNVIRGRVSHKSEVRVWQNASGPGRAFSFDIFDGTGEISVTVFSKIDEIFDLIQYNDVVELQGFRCKTTDPKYQFIPNQNLELIMNPQGTIVKAQTVDDEEIMPEIPYHFRDIVEINKQEQGSSIDFIGIAYTDDGLVEGTGKDGRAYQYRVIHITDKSEYTFDVKVWDQKAKDCEIDTPKSIVLRRSKLQEYDSSKSLSVTKNSMILLNPPMPAAEEILSWFKETTSTK